MINALQGNTTFVYTDDTAIMVSDRYTYSTKMNATRGNMYTIHTTQIHRTSKPTTTSMRKIEIDKYENATSTIQTTR